MIGNRYVFASLSKPPWWVSIHRALLSLLCRCSLGPSHVASPSPCPRHKPVLIEPALSAPHIPAAPSRDVLCKANPVCAELPRETGASFLPAPLRRWCAVTGWPAQTEMGTGSCVRGCSGVACQRRSAVPVPSVAIGVRRVLHCCGAAHQSRQVNRQSPAPPPASRSQSWTSNARHDVRAEDAGAGVKGCSLRKGWFLWKTRGFEILWTALLLLFLLLC